MQEVSNEMKARIFAMYWGCEIVTLTEDGSIKPTPYKYYCNEYIISEIRERGVINARIALKDVADISDEEISAIHEAVGLTMVIPDNSKEYFLKCFSPFAISGMEDRYGQTIYYIVLDKLRDLGFMVPYNSIDLFKEGIAIKYPLEREGCPKKDDEHEISTAEQRLNSFGEDTYK